MIDIAKATETLETYFANVTHEQFAVDLEKFCPELFEEEQKHLELEELKSTEIYQKAKEDHKLEIAPKLLQKGLSVEEVAEILELDVGSIA
jgi:predicted transposase YdaD